MNTKELNHCIKQYNFLDQICLGVFSSDKLPKALPRVPCCLILNTDPSTKPGQHWLALCFDENYRMTYFDSYGRPPNDEFKNYFQRFHQYPIISNIRLQGPLSSTCGQWCLYYMFYFSIYNNMDGFYESFNKKDFHANDHKIVDIIDYYFDYKIPIFIDAGIDLNQICVAAGH